MPEHAGAVERLQDLLELENDPALLDLRCPSTGVLAWPALRNDVFRLLLSDRLYETAPIVDVDHQPSAARATSSAVRTVLHNVRHRPARCEVLIVGTGAGLVARGSHAYNRYTDPLAEALGTRGWTMESLFADTWSSRPRSNHRLGFLGVDRLRLLIGMRASVRPADRSLATKIVDLVTDRGRDILGWTIDPVRRAGLVAMGARRLAVYPLRARLAERLIARTGARVVLLEDGSFGYHAVFNAVARERGVHVAEFQHGMITRGHDAYNVHPLLQASEAYRTTQPPSLLTYGQWWGSQLNAPPDPVPIGNPYRSEVLREWRPAPERNLVVVLGDGIETGLFMALSRKLAESVDAPLRVAFRPHPRERAAVPRTGGEPFVIDEDSDLYGSFARAAVVVGESSTGVFEAVGLVPRVVVWDTPKSRFYFGDHPFARFSDVGEFPQALGRAHPSDAIVGAMWAHGWQDRFFRFLERVSDGR